MKINYIALIMVALSVFISCGANACGEVMDKAVQLDKDGRVDEAIRILACVVPQDEQDTALQDKNVAAAALAMAKLYLKKLYSGGEEGKAALSEKFVANLVKASACDDLEIRMNVQEVIDAFGREDYEAAVEELKHKKRVAEESIRLELDKKKAMLDREREDFEKRKAIREKILTDRESSLKDKESSLSEKERGLNARESALLKEEERMKRGIQEGKHENVVTAAQSLIGEHIVQSETALITNGAYIGPVKEYVVQSGDTVGRIAYEHGIAIRPFKEINGLRDDSLRVGQKFWVPVNVESKCQVRVSAYTQKDSNRIVVKEYVSVDLAKTLPEGISQYRYYKGNGVFDWLLCSEDASDEMFHVKVTSQDLTATTDVFVQFQEGTRSIEVEVK